ncbi:MAG: amino acid permease [Sporolactobacillus sp.]
MTQKRFDHPIKSRARNQTEKNRVKGKGAVIEWWQLSLIGIGSVIGAGFFLGSGLSIHAAGASVLLSYLLAGLTALIVFSSLAEMTVNDPEIGSFRTYGKIAYGDRYAFIFGWVYWVAGLLIVSSEITALATFTRFWLPNIPLWIFCFIYACIGIGIILLGVKDFGTIESFFAVLKLSALIAFILLVLALICGLTPPSLGEVANHSPLQSGLFPNGFSGFWRSMIFVLLSFGGIEILGLTANKCRSEKDVTKAGFSLIFALETIYFLAILSVFATASWPAIRPTESPFVTALAHLHLPLIDSLFNLIILSAAFSTMVGALYSMTTVLASLAADHAAPPIFNQRSKKDVPVFGLLLTLILLTLIDILSYFLPKTVYEYLAAASGTLLILNWLNIIFADLKNRRNYHQQHWRMPGQPYAGYLGIFLIVFSIAGSLFDQQQRISLFFVLGILILIAFLYKFVKKKA